jgi:hypothetical protein
MSMKHKFSIAGAITIAALIIGVSTGAAAVGTSHSTPAAAVAKPANAQGTGPHYHRNASGRTFGSAADANSSEQFPDLIYVSTDQGGRGFVKKEDLEGPRFTKPQDAVVWSRLNSGKPRVITAYASDGKTELGTFTIGRPAGDPASTAPKT